MILIFNICNCLAVESSVTRIPLPLMSGSVEAQYTEKLKMHQKQELAGTLAFSPDTNRISCNTPPGGRLDLF